MAFSICKSLLSATELNPGNSPKCMIRLYEMDNKARDDDSPASILRESKVLFTEKTAHRANEIVASFFNMTKDSGYLDLSVVDSLLENNDYDRYELVSLEKPEVVLGMQILGDRDIVVRAHNNCYYPLGQRNHQQLSIESGSLLLKEPVVEEVPYDELIKRFKQIEGAKKFFITAFWNSWTFTELRACSSNLFSYMVVKKIEAPPRPNPFAKL